MSDLPAKAPMKHEQMVEGSRTVDGLLDDTVRGITFGEHPWSITTVVPPSDTWQQFFHSARESSQKRSLPDRPVEERVQSRVLSAQLDELNKLPTQERKALVQALVENEERFSAIEKSSSKVRDALRAGYMPAVIETQQNVVSNADLINQRALAFEVQSIKKTASEEQDDSSKAILNGALEQARIFMAAPFIERARQSAFLSNDRKVFQAEKMLAEAVKTQIPAEAYASPFVIGLSKNAGKQLDRLKVENHLLESYNANLGKLQISSRDGEITQQELNSAMAKGGDSSFHALAEFLSDNYKYLTRKHFSLFGKEGIRRSDIVDYVKERSRNINDLDI